MTRGKEATKRANRRRKHRKRDDAAANRPVRTANPARRRAPQLPLITEADLFAFQLAHFADHTHPESWFVDPQTALKYDPALDYWEEEDDGLGYYDDGVKRTLTDEQIEMFRHTELEQIARVERLAQEEQGLESESDRGRAGQQPLSPLSDVSSLEEDLVGLATFAPPTKEPRVSLSTAASRCETSALPVGAFTSSERSASTSTKRSETSGPSKSSRPKKKFRKEDVPYDQRNKRKWEEHIATVDPVKGTWMYESKTENRLLREMDDVKVEEVELDY